MNNSEFCNREVVISYRDSTIMEISCLMKKYHTGNVVIVEKKDPGNIPIGIVTDRDIVIKVLAEGLLMDSVVAESIMSSDLHTVPEDESIWNTLELMQKKGIRRVPVINKSRELQGIITVDDILEIIGEEIISLVKTIKKEQIQEERKIGNI